MWHNLPFGRATPWFRYGVPRPPQRARPPVICPAGCVRPQSPPGVRESDRKSDGSGRKRSRAPAPGGRGTEARLGESPGAGGMCGGTWLMCGGDLGKGCEVPSARTPVPTRTPVPRSLVPALLVIEAAFLRHVCAALHHPAHAGGNPAPPGTSSPFAATPGRDTGAHSVARLAATPTRPPRQRGENAGSSRQAVPALNHSTHSTHSAHSAHASRTTHAPRLSSANPRPPTGGCLDARRRSRRPSTDTDTDTEGTLPPQAPGARPAHGRRPARVPLKHRPPASTPADQRSAISDQPPSTIGPSVIGHRPSAIGHRQARDPRRPTERHAPVGRRRFRRLTPLPRSPCRGPASSVPAGRASRSGGCVPSSDRAPCRPRSGCARGRRRCRTAS